MHVYVYIFVCCSLGKEVVDDEEWLGELYDRVLANEIKVGFV
jgi:hypothetical protein